MTMRPSLALHALLVVAFLSIQLYSYHAKKDYNRENPTGVLDRGMDNEDDPTPTDTTRSGRRRAQGVDSQDEFSSSSSSGKQDSLLYQAESLEFFRNGIDPDLFEWLDTDQIVPGGFACGFLKPRLGSLDDVIYPKVSVYVCMSFAKKQPASKGNIFVHCGGPGSTSGCALQSVDKLGELGYSDYNVIGMDQRGVGRSYPSFVHEECALASFVRDEKGTIVNTTLPLEFTQNLEAKVNLKDKDFIKGLLPAYSRRIHDCWTCQSCGFQLKATQEDGSVSHFHFLEYSGTRQLVEDMNRMRIILNAPLLHLYGFNYGTSVMSTYATMFSEYTGLMVLDGNASPNPDHYHSAKTGAYGKNERIDHLVFSCNARNAVEPGSCPVSDIRKCIRDIGFISETFIAILFQHADRAQEICDAAAAGDLVELHKLLEELAPPSDVLRTTISRNFKHLPERPLDMFPTLQGQPIPGNPDYWDIDPHFDIATTLIRGQDRSSPIYDEHRFAKEVVEVAKRYSGAGTGQPGSYFFSEYIHGYYWPKPVPIPPGGNPNIKGIVVGALHDSNTPYIWSQEMKNAFQSAKLLTNQNIFHVVGSNDPDCQRHVIHYFDTGVIGFNDGQVCGTSTDFAGQHAINSVLGSDNGLVRGQRLPTGLQ